MQHAVKALLFAFAFAACATAPPGPSAPGDGPSPPQPVAPTPATEAGPPLVVQIVDVGQGDGIVIISPTGKSIIIDAGDRGRDKAMVEQLVADGITAIDLAIITHPHADHIGGMQKTLAQVPARTFLDPGFDYSSGIYARLLEHLEASGTKVLIARRGRKIDIGGGASLLILAPDEPLLRGTRSDANSNSVVLRLDYGATSMLFTGDSEAPTENRLLSDPDTLTADVLKVAHHGSEHSTQDDFLAAVRPTLAVISCGLDNKFGHPSPPTLEKLARAGVDVLRTDESGTITLTSDATRWSAAVAKGDPPRRRVEVGEAPRPPPAARRLPRDAATRDADPTTVSAVGYRLDINTATVEQLQAVEGVGPAKAAAIVAYRDEHGPFRSMHDVLATPGVGPKTLRGIAERFAVVAPPEAADEDVP